MEREEEHASVGFGLYPRRLAHAFAPAGPEFDLHTRDRVGDDKGRVKGSEGANKGRHQLGEDEDGKRSGRVERDGRRRVNEIAGR